MGAEMLSFLRRFDAAQPGAEKAKRLVSQSPWRSDLRLRAHARADAMVQEPLAQLPWSHQIALLERLSSPEERLGYARQSAASRWSHSTLAVRSADKVVVEYALRDVNKPIGVAQWEAKIVESLPVELRGALPTVEEIEAELSGSTS